MMQNTNVSEIEEDLGEMIVNEYHHDLPLFETVADKEIASLKAKIAELEKENSELKDVIVAHQIADETGYIDGFGWVSNWSEMEGKVQQLLQAHNLEQQSLALSSFRFKKSDSVTVLNHLSDGSYSQEDHDLVFEELKAVEIILDNAASALTQQAKQLREGVK